MMFSTLRKPALVKLYVIPLIMVTTGSMVWAIGVLYALDLGASILQVNLITSIQSTMGILLLVPFGILSDHFGRRPMLLYPRIIGFIGILIRAFAMEPNHLLIAAFVGGFAGGGFFPVVLSMVADIAEPQEQQEAISTLWLFSGVGMLLGPFIGSCLLTIPQITLRNLYQIHAVSQASAILYMAIQIQETKPRTPKEERIQYRTHIVNLLRRTNFRSLLVMSFLFSFYNSIANTYTPMYARFNLNFSDAEVSSLSLYRNLAVVLIRFSSTTFLTRVPVRLFLVSALTIGGISGLAAPFANDYSSLVLVRLLVGVCHGATMILGSTIVAAISTPRNRGIANSIHNVAQSTGQITQIITSPIAESYGFTPVFFLGGISAFMATLPMLLRGYKSKENVE